MSARVVNKRYEAYDVYIGRGSQWGNPFRIGPDGSREDVIRKHKAYLWEQIKAGEVGKADLQELEDKRLGCFCKPLACHGDTLIAAIEWSRS